ncbi:MAG: hypothetical protein Q4F63_03375 [Clostridia bacterium]|nr:hypothetical protein [Clostridia bacterium]
MNKNILENKAFDCLDFNTRRAFVSLTENLKNKSYDEKIAIIVAFVNSLPKGITFTKDERRAMIEAVMEEMSEEEKKRFGGIIRLLL